MLAQGQGVFSILHRALVLAIPLPPLSLPHPCPFPPLPPIPFPLAALQYLLERKLSGHI